MTPTKGNLRFGRERRLKHRRDFERVFRCRCTTADTRLIVHAARNAGEPMRIGIAVGRGYGNAVRRNRFKRLVREAFRHQPDRWPAGFDVVVRPQRVAVEPTLADL
ncbi:MAG: ribonuclease P protein component, partial [Phycisphaerae bacterium]|nr:ribonuclease P protein component [Phycisphaerae bacterium]